MITIGESLSLNAIRIPEKIALVYGNQKMTYRELDQRASKLAGALLAAGLKKDDKIGVLLENNKEIVEILFGCAKVGIIAVLINFRSSANEVNYILETYRCKGLISHSDYAEICLQIPDGIKLRLRAGEKEKLPDWLDYDQFVSSGAPLAPPYDVKPEDCWVILFTTGFTGRPKAVMRCHDDMLMSNFYGTIQLGFTENDIMLVVMPICHLNGLEYSLMTLFCGATEVIYTERTFQAEAVLRLMRDQNVTAASLVPTMFHKFFALPEDVQKELRPGHFRVLITSSMPMTTQMKNRILDYFTGSSLWEVYGGSENGYVTVMKPQDQLRKVRSVGMTWLGVEIKLVDQSGNEIKEVNTVGELFFRGQGNFRGYYEDPVNTADTIKDGWCGIGDLAKYDDEGFIYLVDRKKDKIITGGENVFPTEVEEILLGYPGIDEVAIIGLPDDMWGEKIHAVIVPKPGVSLDKGEIIAFAKENMAKFKVPKSIDFLNEPLPKTATGKVLRRELRERAKKD